MKQITIIIVLTALLLVPMINAQDLITDRPDFTESALAIPARMIQIESGAEYVDFKTMEELTYPNALARIGLGHNLEVRLGFSGWASVTENSKTNTYLNDVLLEAKYQFTGDDATVPFAALLVSTLPTGDDEISVGSAEVGLVLASSYDFNDRLGVGVNAGAISVDAGEDRDFMTLASVAMGIGINDRLGGFIEVLAEMPQNETWQPVVDGGFTFLVTPVAQLDLYVGKGLNDYGPDLIIGGGFSFRFGY